MGQVAAVETALKIDSLETARGLRLHPTQFSEIAALCAHWRARLNRIPKYVSIGGGDQPDQLVTLPLGGMSSKPVFDDFGPELYAHLLSLFTGYDLDRVWWQDRREIWSSLKNQEGEPLQMPRIDEHAIEPPVR